MPIRTHGRSKKPWSGTYRSWVSMKQRCYNPKNPKYADYGGRGIGIYPEWKTSFVAFLRDIGECPPGYSIDRIDNDGGYEPGNCRWADDYTQAQNRRNNHHVTLGNERIVLAEAGRRTAISAGTIKDRIKKLGWNESDALARPVERHRRFTGLETDRQCTRCHLVKPLDQFVRQSDAPSGRGPHCGACNRERVNCHRRLHGRARA